MHNDELSARRFTTSAIHIIEQLVPRAADRGMTTEYTEQTAPALGLWAILRWERKVGLTALEALGVDVDALARDVDRALDEAGRESAPPTLHTLPSGEKVLAMDFRRPVAPLLTAAEEEARGLGHSWVGSEHLVLAIVRVADARLRKVLAKHRLGYDRVRQAVLGLLTS